MPTMPRINGKPKEIAYKILGTPANIKSKRKPNNQKANERLVFEETQRVR